MKSIITATALMIATAAFAADTKSLYEIPLKDIDGKDASLKPHQGKVMLVVNVASKCGFTPQYKGLEALYQKYKGQGLAVLGFPCNDFRNQEPATNEEIKQFCSTTYNVTFPLYDKLHVKGPEKHPLYAALTGPESPYRGEVTWNFNKFLVGKDGKILKHFDSKVTPESAELTAAIEAALKAK